MSAIIENAPQTWQRVARGRRKAFLGITKDDAIRYFFGGNAITAIVILALIMIFLFKEGWGFFSQERADLELKRQAGIELVDIVKREREEFTNLSRLLTHIRVTELKALMAEGATPENASLALTKFDAFESQFGDLASDLIDVTDEMTEVASEIKTKFESADTPTDLNHERQALVAMIPQFASAAEQLQLGLTDLVKNVPEVVPHALKELAGFQKAARIYAETLPEAVSEARRWDPANPVAWHESLTEFIFGKQWVTNSWWQDSYGIIPLLCGSLMISFLAIAISAPLGIGGAIYINQIASRTEQHWIKPYIEFISAIPSVVLGFWGIAVFGDGIVWLSHQPFLAWVPFFPLQGGLNIFTAGCLLGLMAVPTIFTLAEDAINNVPRALKEASFALGATKLQTIGGIIVPSALSGIISAVLLGFGRVIGETMVVLLVAGNRIAIPDFTQGLGAFFQPAHTMTGIIAQELGEVVNGSLHYRALFMVGMLLFCLSLVINFTAQRVVERYQLKG